MCMISLPFGTRFLETQYLDIKGKGDPQRQKDGEILDFHLREMTWRVCPMPLPELLGGCWQSLACGRITPASASVAMWHSPCVSVSKFPFYKDTSHWVRAHLTPVWSHLYLIISAKAISKQCHIYRLQGVGLEHILCVCVARGDKIQSVTIIKVN